MVFEDELAECNVSHFYLNIAHQLNSFLSAGGRHLLLSGNISNISLKWQLNMLQDFHLSTLLLSSLCLSFQIQPKRGKISNHFWRGFLSLYLMCCSFRIKISLPRILLVIRFQFTISNKIHVIQYPGLQKFYNISDIIIRGERDPLSGFEFINSKFREMYLSRLWVRWNIFCFLVGIDYNIVYYLTQPSSQL